MYIIILYYYVYYYIIYFIIAEYNILKISTCLH